MCVFFVVGYGVDIVDKENIGCINVQMLLVVFEGMYDVVIGVVVNWMKWQWCGEIIGFGVDRGIWLYDVVDFGVDYVILLVEIGQYGFELVFGMGIFIIGCGIEIVDVGVLGCGKCVFGFFIGCDLIEIFYLGVIEVDYGEVQVVVGKFVCFGCFY